MPIIKKTKLDLESIELIGYDKLSEGQTDKIVHFFLDDYKFEVLWKDPEPRVEKLKEYRALLESVTNNPNNYLGTDSMNTQWYAQIQSDGSQVWARVWNGSIFNGGINEIPREWNPITGLNNNPIN